MAKIGTLTADLSLESAAFIRDLKRAADATARNTKAMSRDMARMQSAFATAGSAIKGALAGFISVAAVRSFASLARTIVTSADEIGDAATKLGLSAEELQRFRAAAVQTDVDVSKLDNALKVFAKNIATGKAGDATKTLSENFFTVIEQIRNAGSQTEKTAIAVKNFGKAWQDAMLLAQGTGEEFKRQFDGAFTVSQRAIDIADGMMKAWERFENALTTGVTEGFLTGLNTGLGNVEVNLADINRLGVQMGEVVGKAIGFLVERSQAWLDVLTKINNFLRIEIPQGMSGIDAQMSAQSKFWSDATQQSQQAAGSAAVALGINDIGKAAAFAAPEVEKLNTNMAAAGNTAAAMGSMHKMTASQVTMGWLSVAETVAGAMGTLFNENKAVAIAMAVINTAQAITAALAQFPPPLSFAMAAAQAAAGAAQIAVIAKTKPGGGSSAPSVRGGKGGRAAHGGSGVAAAGSVSGLHQSVNIKIVGESFGPEHFKKLVEGINGVVADGAVLRVT